MLEDYGEIFIKGTILNNNGNMISHRNISHDELTDYANQLIFIYQNLDNKGYDSANMFTKTL